MEEWNPDEQNNKEVPVQPSLPVQHQVQPVQSDPIREMQTPTNNDIYDVIIGLPTDGRLYPEGTVIKARPLKVTEVKILAGMTEDNADDIVNDILQRTVIGIDINDIYTADKLFIMFWLRANTYKESGYNVKFECGKCNTDSEFAFELDQLEIKKLTKETLNFLNNSFDLPNKDKITFSLLTVGDEKENVKFLKTNKSSLMNFDPEILAVCRMIDTINGKKLGMIDKYMYITDTLNPSNYSFLESYLEDKSVGLEPTITVKCQKCGGASNTMLPFRPDFFLPKIRI
jgi:hypothetical protein